MKITELLNGIEYSTCVGQKQLDVNNLYYDSRHVTPGSLFFCIKGMKADGHEFAKQAVSKGAVVLVVERILDDVGDVMQIQVKDSRKAMALISSNFYRNPTRNLVMIGVTGTNGKTSTTYMVKSIAECMGKKVGLIGTITNMIGDRKIAAERTTPESLDLQKMLAEMVQEEVDWVVMEVSSHSLDLGRVEGIQFDVGIFTNLTQDHLDYHETIENYRSAKKKLFLQSKKAVINVDDNSGPFMVEGVDIPVLTYSIHSHGNINAHQIKITAKGASFDLTFPDAMTSINLDIPGLFSIYNSMAAAGACYALRVPVQKIKEGLESVKGISGRFEVLDTKTEYTVIVDYAHTPDGLENILNTVKEFAKGRIVTLFGCGGDRDKGKRPQMGEIAGRYSDFCIITSDNPRSEEPMSIIRDIEKGIQKTNCEYICIENRKEAIQYALEHGEKDDVIILAGKGHETYQQLKDKTIHFDEKEIVAELLNRVT